MAKKTDSRRDESQVKNSAGYRPRTVVNETGSGQGAYRHSALTGRWDLVKLRARRDLADLDYRRALRKLVAEAGVSQVEVAAALNVSQPTISKAVQAAKALPDPLEGFAGATPLEICQRYAAGEITREDLVDELARFPYVEGDQTDGYDSLLVDPPGAWSELDLAESRGLIDSEVYAEVFAAIYPDPPA